MTTAPKEADKYHWRFWLLMVIGFCLVIWALSSVLGPFVLGLAIAYFLNPSVSGLAKWKLPRWAAAFTVLLIFIAVVSTAFIFLTPLVREQIVDLTTALPGYVERLQSELWPRIKDILEHVPGVDLERMQSSFAEYTGDAVNFAGKLVGGVVTSSMAILDILALLILTPVISFYLLRDWPEMTAKVESYLPVRYAPTIRAELKNIDNMIAGFVRGQAMVSICLALFYSIGLSLVGLKYGMVIGLVAGLLSFIPIVGTISGITASLIMAFIQYDTMGPILAVAGVFVAAQLVDGNFLTPKLVGDRVGLHPVWIMFAVIAGGKLLGFIGVILGVPIVGTIAILLRLALRQYKRSRYFS